MLERGAFRDVPARPVADGDSICRSAAASKSRAISTPKNRPFAELVAEHFDELRRLLNHFRNPANGYPARPFPQFAARYNAYDHLARTREWSASGAEVRPAETSHERRRASPRIRPGRGRRSPPIRAASAWVSANAGSGKTHVLAQRVIRLLLAGTAARPHSVPDLHQGGGRQYGRAGVQEPCRVVVARR